jgi:vitamin B12 transporter
VFEAQQHAVDKKGTSPDRKVIGPGIFIFSGQVVQINRSGGLAVMKPWVLPWVVAGWVLWALPVWGETVVQSEAEVSVLDPLVVTASRVEEKKSDVTTNITLVTEEQIQQSGAKDLGGLLGELGFPIVEYPNALISVGIRGFRTETLGNDLTGHVLVLINGRRAGTGNLAKILVDNVARIEIIRGPGSVQYGSSAMGGVVNVITKEGQGKPTVYVDGTLGSWNYQEASAGGSGQVKDLDFSFSVSKSSQDDYTTARGDKYANTGFDSKQRISVNAGYTFLPENRIGVSYTGYSGEGIGSPNYLSQNDPDDTVENAINTVDLVYDGQTTNGFLLWNLRYFKGKDEYDTYDPQTSTEATYTRDTDQQGAQAQLTTTWSHAHISIGGDWANYAIDDTYSSGDNTYDNPAAFIMAKVKLLDDRLVLSAGGRYDWYDVESDDGRSVEDSNWSTRLGAAFKLFSGLSVRANYAEAFRMPTADELYMFNDYSAWGFGVWSGNENLKPEKSQTYEAGIDFSAGSLTSGLTYFHTNFEDKIDHSYDAAEDITRYENIGSATIAGIEGTVQVDIGAFWGWAYELVPYASVTYLTEYKNDETHEDLQYNPEWTVSCGLRLVNREIGFVSNLNIAYIDEQDIIDYEGTGETTLGSYTVAELTISKTLFAFTNYGDVSIKADIRNLFDREYATTQGYPMPGRSFFVGLKMEY